MGGLESRVQRVHGHFGNSEQGPLHGGWGVQFNEFIGVRELREVGLGVSRFLRFQVLGVSGFVVFEGFGESGFGGCRVWGGPA